MLGQLAASEFTSVSVAWSGWLTTFLASVVWGYIFYYRTVVRPRENTALRSFELVMEEVIYNVQVLAAHDYRSRYLYKDTWYNQYSPNFMFELDVETRTYLVHVYTCVLVAKRGKYDFSDEQMWEDLIDSLNGLSDFCRTNGLQLLSERIDFESGTLVDSDEEPSPSVEAAASVETVEPNFSPEKTDPLELQQEDDDGNENSK